MSFDHTSGKPDITGISNDDQPTGHGANVAQVVWDIAPGARYTLVNYHTQLELSQAVDWLVNGPDGKPRVDIVVHSNSFLEGPVRRHGRGRQGGRSRARRGHLLGELRGQLCAAPLGGRRRRRRPRRLGRHRAVRPRLPVVPADGGDRHGGDALLECLHAERRERRGHDGALRDRRHGHRPGVARRVRPGSGRRVASGRLVGYLPAVAGTYGLRVQQSTANVVCDLEIFGGGVELGQEATLASSIPTPGDARGSFTVGARDWQGDAPAAYSSQGPTQDGRLKPDVVAPASTAIWPGIAMVGTSASAPHAAGAAALLMQHDRAAGQPSDPDAIAKQLIGERARHRAARARRGHRRGAHPARRRRADVGLDGAVRRAAGRGHRRASTSPSTTPARSRPRASRSTASRRPRCRASCTCASTRARWPRARTRPCSGRATWPGTAPSRRSRSSATERGRSSSSRRAGTPSTSPSRDAESRTGSLVARIDDRAGGQHWARTLPLTFAGGHGARADRSAAAGARPAAACASRRSTRSVTPRAVATAPADAGAPMRVARRDALGRRLARSLLPPAVVLDVSFVNGLEAIRSLAAAGAP